LQASIGSKKDAVRIEEKQVRVTQHAQGAQNIRGIASRDASENVLHSGWILKINAAIFPDVELLETVKQVLPIDRSRAARNHITSGQGILEHLSIQRAIGSRIGNQFELAPGGEGSQGDRGPTSHKGHSARLRQWHKGEQEQNANYLSSSK